VLVRGRCTVPVAAFEVQGAGSLAMLRCPGCGTARLAPTPGDEVLAAAYARDYYGGAGRKFRGPAGGAFARAHAVRARRAARLRAGAGRLLDVGCGAGELLLAMRARGWSVEGTERTAGSAARVPAVPGLRVHVGELEALPLPAGRYDVVTLWHVLEHLRDPLAALRRAHALLAPGGHVLLAVPNAASWQARLFGRHWFHHDPPRHLWAFAPSGLAALLAQAGFAPGPMRTFSLAQNPYGVLQSTLNAIGFPRDRAYDLLKGVSRSAGAGLVDAASLALLAVPALAFALAEAAARRGGTLTAAARRTEVASPVPPPLPLSG